MPHKGTTAVLKDVERAGKTFQQHYWMKLEDLANVAKKGGWQAAVVAAGGDPKHLNMMLKEWTGSSTSVEGCQLQGAAMALMGGDKADWPIGAMGNYKKHVNDGYKDKKTKQTVLAAQATTRAVLESGNYKPRTMYRGMTGKVAEAIIANAKKLADQGIPYHEAALGLKLNPLNSFSETNDTAQKFGGGSSGVILAVHDVPASAYMSHYKVQGAGTVGFSSEKEGIVITQGTTGFRMQDIRGGAGKQIMKYFKDKGLYDPAKVENDDHPPGGWKHGSNPNKSIGSGGAAEEEDEPSYVASTPKYEKTGQKWKQWMTTHMATLDPNLSVKEVDNLLTKIDASTLDYLNKHGFAKTGQKFSEDQVKQIIHGFTEHHVTGTAKPGAPKKMNFGNLPTVDELPDIPEHLAKTPVQQKKGKGAVPEWGGAKTWRDLWVKWAKQHAKEQGHTESSAKAIAHNAVDKANVDLKKFIAHKNPAKAQFKAFFAKVIQEHIPKKK